MLYKGQKKRINAKVNHMDNLNRTEKQVTKIEIQALNDCINSLTRLKTCSCIKVDLGKLTKIDQIRVEIEELFKLKVK